jgi:hypothetical protein
VNASQLSSLIADLANELVSYTKPPYGVNKLSNFGRLYSDMQEASMEQDTQRKCVQIINDFKTRGFATGVTQTVRDLLDSIQQQFQENDQARYNLFLLYRAGAYYLRMSPYGPVKFDITSIQCEKLDKSSLWWFVLMNINGDTPFAGILSADIANMYSFLADRASYIGLGDDPLIAISQMIETVTSDELISDLSDMYDTINIQPKDQTVMMQASVSPSDTVEEGDDAGADDQASEDYEDPEELPFYGFPVQGGFLAVPESGVDKSINLSAITPANSQDIQEQFMQHIFERLTHLEYILDHNPDVEVTISGKDGEFTLGGALAKSGWESRGMVDTYNEIFKFLGEAVGDLIKNYPKRIRIGKVDGSQASPTHIHVWGAHAYNWLTPHGVPIIGKGGEALDVKVNNLGTFGIATSPVAGVPSRYEIMDIRDVEQLFGVEIPPADVPDDAEDDEPDEDDDPEKDLQPARDEAKHQAPPPQFSPDDDDDTIFFNTQESTSAPDRESSTRSQWL